jgi:hypothetical protein
VAADTTSLHLRLPKALYKKLRRQARFNNVSLNTEIVNQLEGSDVAIAKRMAEALRPALDSVIEEAIQRATGERQHSQAELELGMILEAHAPRTEAELKRVLREADASGDRAALIVQKFREIRHDADLAWIWEKPEKK